MSGPAQDTSPEWHQTGLARCLTFLTQVGVTLRNRGRQYGESAFQPGRFGMSAETKCLARLSEKLDRFEAHLRLGTDDEDTLTDIVGYFVILYAIRQQIKESAT